MASLVCRRVFYISVAVAAIGTLGLIWCTMCSLGGIPWNAPRLAPSFALAHGLPIYSLRSSGAQLGWIYGPVFPLWFLPVGLIKNLTLAFPLAGALNAATVLAPMYLAVRRGLRQTHGFAGLATLLASALIFSNPLTCSLFFMIHVDALCIFLGVMACLSLHSFVADKNKTGLYLGACFTVLAIWTKQIAIGLVPAMLCYLWRETSPRTAGRWLWYTAVGGGLLTLAFFLLFGTQELMFNAVLFHLRSPGASSWNHLGRQCASLIAAFWPWLAVAGAAWGFRRSGGGNFPSGRALSLARALGWAALWQIPLGISASMKVGGGFNSLHSISYLLIAALVMGVDWFSRNDRNTIGAAYLAILLVTTVEGYRLAEQRGVIWTPDQGQAELVAMARREPGRFYFPWNPLVTIVAEKRVYPFDDAMLCLWRAGLEPSPQTIQRTLPKGVVVVYPEQCQSRFMLDYLRDNKLTDYGP